MWTHAAVVGLFVLSCLGLGGTVLRRLSHRLPAFPAATHFAVAYFLGQGLLVVAFFALALAGLLYPAVVLTLLIAGAVLVPRLVRDTRGDWQRGLGRGIIAFWRVPFTWKFLAVLSAGLYLYGFTTIGATMTVDAAAFYLPVATLTAYSHALIPLPGYDQFTVVASLYAEVMLAALMGLGLPFDLVRAVSWLNYLPTLVVLWALAGAAGLGGRGRLLALVVGLTSSAVLVLWGGGKTDLYAVGPSLVAVLFALLSWAPHTRYLAATLAGLFAGLAVGFKFSLLVVLPPALFLILGWPFLFRLARALRRRSARRAIATTRRGLTAALLCGGGLLLALLPHFVKNLALGGSLLGFTGEDTDWFAPDTTRRLLLTYPFALTYGRYWAQYGNLSPLVLAFIPLLLLMPRARSWARSRLTALSLATLVGLIIWIILVPSVFMPRYILGPLLMLGIPAAAAAAWLSRADPTSNAVIVLAAAMTIVFTPSQVASWQSAFDATTTLRRLSEPHPDECLTAKATIAWCRAQQAINRASAGLVPTRDANRVLIFSWFRIWLRPEFLLTANRANEFDDLKDARDPWQLVRERGFRYAFLDEGYPHTRLLLNRLPADRIREIYRDATLTAYEIEP